MWRCIHIVHTCTSHSGIVPAPWGTPTSAPPLNRVIYRQPVQLCTTACCTSMHQHHLRSSATRVLHHLTPPPVCYDKPYPFEVRWVGNENALAITCIAHTRWLTSREQLSTQSTHKTTEGNNPEEG